MSLKNDKIQMVSEKFTDNKLKLYNSKKLQKKVKAILVWFGYDYRAMIRGPFLRLFNDTPHVGTEIESESHNRFSMQK